MNKRKLVATSLLIAIALSTVGYVYAAWTDLVYIYGTVEMGSLTLAWDSFEPPVATKWHLPPGGTSIVLGEYLGKDVASCTAYWDETTLVIDDHWDPPKTGYKKFIIKVENAYPQLYIRTTYVLHNIGTIPITLYKLEAEGVKMDYMGNEICSIVYDDALGGFFEDYDGDGIKGADENVVINLVWVNGFPLQLDPSDINKGEIDLDFKQEAQECHTYVMKFNVLGIQWNKIGEVTP